MNWQMLLHFLRRVVPAGEHETEELLQIYAKIQELAHKETKAA
ncbi:hypothetical protein UFOVP1083_14 [uncultured Caudovirales phage]|jgi:hypothetical protein|uniref:Uncharacterized protein n=1 Tax=uncultured Caudovirales phage TaxID=2100421 RepID=A0A6J5RZQ3_9CAUD|nr:hypothetical protein UFOVP1083_14 [uncultured Caudovirales phage]CAB4199411.1 hypothetical protein UFOVP1327_39 [uncultured Caudovirales phage]